MSENKIEQVAAEEKLCAQDAAGYLRAISSGNCLISFDTMKDIAGIIESQVRIITQLKQELSLAYDANGQIEARCKELEQRAAGEPRVCLHEWSATRYLHECLKDCGATMSAKTGAVRVSASQSDAEGSTPTKLSAQGEK